MAAAAWSASGCCSGDAAPAAVSGGVSCRMIMERAFRWRSAWLLLDGASDSSCSRGSAPGLKLERLSASALDGGGGGRKDGGGPESRRKSEVAEEEGEVTGGGGGGAV